VICVGRWHRPDWAQKNPALLLEALTLFLRQNPGSSAIIVGGGAQALGQTRWARPILEQNLPVRFLDHLPHAQLVDLLATSRISICSSTYEAAHLTSFEALCCGCSIVTTTGPALPSVYWGAQENGTIASGPDAPALAQALADETQAWDQGKRDPHASSRTWSQRVHAPQAAAHALHLLALEASAANTTCLALDFRPLAWGVGPSCPDLPWSTTIPGYCGPSTSI